MSNANKVLELDFAVTSSLAEFENNDEETPKDENASLIWMLSEIDSFTHAIQSEGKILPSEIAILNSSQAILYLSLHAIKVATMGVIEEGGIGLVFFIDGIYYSITCTNEGNVIFIKKPKGERPIIEDSKNVRIVQEKLNTITKTTNEHLYNKWNPYRVAFAR